MKTSLAHSTVETWVEARYFKHYEITADELEWLESHVRE